MRRVVVIVFVVIALVFATAAVANKNDSTVGESGNQPRSAVHSPALTGLDLALMAGAVVVLVGVGVGLRRAARTNSSTENAELAEQSSPV